MEKAKNKPRRLIRRPVVIDRTGKGTSVSKAKNPAGARDTMPKIGRGNPPKHTQFKKGVSGNKNGRPKGSKNLSTLLMAAARDQVTATIDGKPRKISKLQATVMQLATKAAGGDRASIDKLLDWVDDIETRAARRVSLQRSRS